jgi:HAD superfamily hydrolase (TIGR01549 family)
MLKGVTFDFGGTLAFGELNKAQFRNSFINYIKKLGFSGKVKQIRDARKKVVGSLVATRSLNREIRFEDLYQSLLFRLGLHPEKEVIKHIHVLYIRSFKVELFPEAEGVLKFLKRRYKLAIISNAISNLPRESIMKFRLGRYLDSIVVSRDIGIRKPDPEIFKFTLNNLGLESNEALHVGDSLEYDVQGAVNAGMKSIWIKRSKYETYIQPTYTVDSLQKITELL